MGCSDSIKMESPENLNKFNAALRVGFRFDRGVFVFGK